MIGNIFSFIDRSKIEPSTLPVNGRIDYEFRAKEYIIKAYQEELDIEQNQKLVELLSKFKLNSGTFDTQTVDVILKFLKEQNLIAEFLKIILTIDYSVGGSHDTTLKYLKLSELEKILMDFFSLNPTLMRWLKSIESILILLLKTQNTDNTESPETSSMKDFQNPPMKI